MIKPCPICGKVDRVQIVSEDVYDSMLQNYYDGITENVPCISIRCWECSLELYNHSSICSYKCKKKQLIEKWNAMPRREEPDDGE